MADIDINDPTIRAKLSQLLAGGNAGQSPYPKAEEPGMQGFGKINKELLANAAGGMDDRLAVGLMNSGSDNLAGGGGLVARKSPFASIADGVKQGIGTYGLLSSIKAKRDSAGALGDILSPKSKSKALRGLADDSDVPLTDSGELAIDP